MVDFEEKEPAPFQQDLLLNAAWIDKTDKSDLIQLRLDEAADLEPPELWSRFITADGIDETPGIQFAAIPSTVHTSYIKPREREA